MTRTTFTLLTITLLALTIAACQNSALVSEREMAAFERVEEGVTYAVAGDHQAALGQFNAALEIDPGNPHALYNLGILHIDLGDPEAALTYFDQAIESDPEYSLAYYHRGQTHYNLGHTQVAIDDFKRYLELAPDDPKWGDIEAFVDKLELELGSQ